jgi:hypothetical protein
MARIIHHSQFSIQNSPIFPKETTRAIAHHDKRKHPPGGSVYGPAHGLSLREVIYTGDNMVTLMFSLRHYEAVSAAYLRGLERLLDGGGDVSQVASAASFFVSRVDSAVDEQLDQLADESAQTLKGRIGIANAKMAYLRYLQVFSSPRW